MGKLALHGHGVAAQIMLFFPQMPPRLGRLKVSTVFVDNFVDKGKLIHGNRRLPPCERRKPGKKPKLIPL
jgi:hypothetical protein